MENVEETLIESVLSGDTSQLCGFKILDGQYAIPVLEVQEVVRPQKITPVPLGPKYVDGLINLRGQIVTAINLRVLFNLPPRESQGEDDDYMNIIVRWGDGLYALVVDEIMDVIDVENSTFEETPDMIDENIKKYIRGVFKLENTLLTLLSLEKLLDIKS